MNGFKDKLTTILNKDAIFDDINVKTVEDIMYIESIIHQDVSCQK